MGRIGITGASGFIGNNVAKYLADRGYKIVAFGRESDRNFDHNNVEWKIVDLNSIQKGDFEGVGKLIHFAGAYTAQDAFSKNVSMLKKVLDIAHDAEVENFYMISTYAVFGDRKTPANITAPYAPLEAYAMSKVIGEEEFNRRKSSGQIKGTIIRPCSIYGKYGRNFVDIIKEKIKKQEEIQMVCFRNQFLHVDDFSEELIKIIEEKNLEPSYNIEGEVITEMVLKDIFEEMNTPFSLSDHQTRSYWCKGNFPLMKNNVRKYLNEAKKEVTN